MAHLHVTVLLAAVLLAAALGVVSAAGGGAASGAATAWRFLVLREDCVPEFLAGNLLAQGGECLRATISKALGYTIITGALVVKVPQIVAILRARSVAGLDRAATYLDLAGYLLQCGYYVALAKPFSAYGETVVISVQSVAIVGLLWAFDFPGVAHTGLVAGVLAAAAAAPFSLPPSYLPALQAVTTTLFVASRAKQIAANYSAGSTGQLAFITLFMNFAGSSARIFTSAVEVKQVEVLVSFILSSALNGILVAQYVYYNFMAAAAKPAPAAKAPAPASAPAPAPGSAAKRASSAASAEVADAVKAATAAAAAATAAEAAADAVIDHAAAPSSTRSDDAGTPSGTDSGARRRRRQA